MGRCSTCGFGTNDDCCCDECGAQLCEECHDDLAGVCAACADEEMDTL